MNKDEEIEKLKQQIDKLWKRTYEMQEDIWRLSN